MALRAARTPVSNLSTSSPTSEQTTPDATDNASTPATSQLDVSETPELATSSKDSETAPEPTRRRVTRSSLGQAVNNIKDSEGDPGSQLLEELESSGPGKVTTGGSGNIPVAKRLSRTRRSIAMEGVEDDHATDTQETSLKDEDSHAGDEVESGREAPVSYNTEDEQQLNQGIMEDEAPQGEPEKKVKEKAKPDNDRATRRSTRIILLEKNTEVVVKTPTVLGKRSRSKEEEKPADRRSGLRPRNTIKPPEGKASTESPAKELRSIKSKTPAASKATAQKTQPEKVKTVPYKKKRWLSHGLYAGQHAYSTEVVPAKTKKKSRKSRNGSDESTRTLLPLPMYSGATLLETGRSFKLPFDIFSPLPSGQPKPDEWRKTNKNVFVGDAASIWKATKITEMSHCMCTPETGCDDNCQNRYMFYECDDTNCKLGEEQCGNRSFAGLRQRCKAGGKFNIGVEVIKTADRGYGVRSNRYFAPNQIIVEYTGEIITQEECERRMRTIYKDNECYYLMYFDQNMIIDATRGSIARFVNHSCEPNCRMEKWTVAGKPRMALFAGENGIMTAEELSYDYNFDPYSLKNAQECRCGAPACRGILGPRPKETRCKDEKEKKKTASAPKPKKNAVKPLSTGGKRKQEVILDESTSQLNKKRKVGRPSKASLAKEVKKVVVTTTVRTTRTTKKAAAATAAETTSKARASSRQSKTTTTKGRKTAAAATSTSSKLRMPSKPRLTNSISTARSAGRTPAGMKEFLSQGKKLHDEQLKSGTTSDDPVVSGRRGRTTRSSSKRY